MAKEQDLLIKIKADTSKAVSEIKDLSKSIKTIGTESDKVAKQATKIETVSKGYSGLGKTLTGVVAGFGALGVAVKAVEFAKMASEAEQSADAFNRIFEDMGLDAEAEFNKIKEASFGLIPDQAIQQSAVVATSLGVPVTKLAELMEIARAKSREMGTDVKSAFNDLAVGIGRGSPMILDNLGLVIKLEEANKKWATANNTVVSAMTKTQKQLALTNAVIEAGQSSVERFADAGLSANEKFQQMNATLDNLKVELGKGLLTVMVDLAEQTNDWVKTLDPEQLEAFGKGIASVGQGLIGILKTVGLLNDAVLPDWLFGDGATFLGKIAEGWQIIGEAVDVAGAEFDAMFNATDIADQQAEKIASLSRAVKEFADNKEALAGLKDQLEATWKANDKLIQSWSESGTDLYNEDLKRLYAQQEQIEEQLSRIAQVEAYEKVAESAKDAENATQQLAEATADYTEENIRTVGEFYKERLTTSKKTLSGLLAQEKALTKSIEKAHQDLAKELQDIADERFDSNLDITDEIRDAQQEALTVYEQFADKQREAEEKLQLAKTALINGQLEHYKTYVEQYKTLALETADSEITVAGVVKKTAGETATAKIAILNNIKSLEDDYFNQRTQNAQNAHDLAVAQAEAELQGVQATIEAMKLMIDLMKTFVEATTGKTLELDTTQLDGAVAKLEASNTLVESLTRRQGIIALDSTQVDTARAKVEQITQATINGITLTIDANTTPADFDIKKLITKVDGDEITLEVNPEWEEAEKELERAFDDTEKEPIEKTVEVDTSTADGQVDAFKARAEEPTTHVINVNNTAVTQAVAINRQPTSSTHTIYIREVRTRAEGGVMPQKLAVGGTFRGSGRVAGYDATDSDGVNAFLTGGEFVLKRKAVDLYGVNFLNALNSMKIPKPKGYANGGLVSSVQPQANTLRPLNLNIGGNSFGALIPSEVAGALQLFIDEQGGL